jgi:hypothetical protein
MDDNERVIFELRQENRVYLDKIQALNREITYLKTAMSWERFDQLLGLFNKTIELLKEGRD